MHACARALHLALRGSSPGAHSSWESGEQRSDRFLFTQTAVPKSLRTSRCPGLNSILHRDMHTKHTGGIARLTPSPNHEPLR